jgi:hypothetical protein
MSLTATEIRIEILEMATVVVSLFFERHLAHRFSEYEFECFMVKIQTEP